MKYTPSEEEKLKYKQMEIAAKHEKNMAKMSQLPGIVKMEKKTPTLAVPGVGPRDTSTIEDLSPAALAEKKRLKMIEESEEKERQERMKVQTFRGVLEYLLSILDKGTNSVDSTNSKAKEVETEESLYARLKPYLPIMTHDKVLLFLVPEVLENQMMETDSGILLLNHGRKKTKFGRIGEREVNDEIKWEKGFILDIGPGIDYGRHQQENASKVGSLQYKVGDLCASGYFAGTDIEYLKVDYKICREYDLMCKLPK